jgi:hypothetical protein
VGARRPAINGGGGWLGGAAVSAGEAPGTGVGVRGALKEARLRGAGGSWGEGWRRCGRMQCDRPWGRRGTTGGG